MKNQNSFGRWSDRIWREPLKRFAAAPRFAIGRKDTLCFLGVIASFALGLAASWQRWGNPLVDSGRELNVPQRLLRGEMLYSDVGYIYGPLSPYLNALLYRMFHPSLWVIWGRGIVCTVVVLAMVYWIARQIMDAFPAALACTAVTWICALKSQGNYMLAYSFGGLDGCILVLTTAALTICFLRTREWRFLIGAACAAGLAVLAKTEFGGAAIGTGLVAVVFA